MKSKKLMLNLIKTLAIILIASLIYVVYFTEAGEPEIIENDRQITMLDQTALPTLLLNTKRFPQPS